MMYQVILVNDTSPPVVVMITGDLKTAINKQAKLLKEGHVPSIRRVNKGNK